MTGNQYQALAMTTLNKELSTSQRLLNAGLGLAGESGEFCDILKKATFQKHALDKDHLKRELGDILWYVALACDSLNTDMDTIMQTNIDKLRARYPKGFEGNKSVNRDLKNR